MPNKQTPDDDELARFEHYRHLPGSLRVKSDATGAGTRVEVCADDGAWHSLTCASLSIEIVPGGGTVATIKIHNPHVEISCASVHDSATSKG